MNPLALHGLTKHYPGFTLGPLDLEVPRGYVMGLVGANGAGKTTLIKSALGLVLPDGGQISLVDKAKVGVVFDQPAFNGDWRTGTLAKALAPFYPTWNGDRFDQLLRWADIDPRRKVRELSRGMGMKLQIALALAHDAEFLILDEPTSGLDPLARSQLLDLLADFMTDPDHSVLFSSHITTDLERLADYVTVIDHGRIIASGTTSDLLDSYRMVRGGADQLPTELRAMVRGLREHRTGWDGLMSTEDTVHLPRGAATEQPSLDDIVVHLAKDPVHV